jgi:hypothetical protein
MCTRATKLAEPAVVSGICFLACLTFSYYAHYCPPYWLKFLRVFSTRVRMRGPRSCTTSASWTGRAAERGQKNEALSRSAMQLSAEQCERFRRDHFLVVRDVLPPTTIEAMCAELNDNVTAAAVVRLCNVPSHLHACCACQCGTYALN